MMNRRFTSAAIAAATSLALLAGTGSAVADDADATIHATTNSSGSSVKAGADVDGGKKDGSSVNDVTAKIKDTLGSSKDNADNKNGSSVNDVTAKIKDTLGSSKDNADNKNGSSVNDVTAKIKDALGSSKDKESDSNANGGFKLVLGLGALALVFSFAYNWAVQNHLIAPLFR
ncbi:hypothetical protein OS128_03745 [Corynebacterium sp. P5848]|uniref:hypothetical protein n=1 Tax=Corynebacterium marambiense TaxID=2765364 RepID=UPI002260D39F|nr:hypothetical protein [Corynebacterium marambiense]MCX7542028.1 hypothetical protein [Corynebacterium marambiense]